MGFAARPRDFPFLILNLSKDIIFFFLFILQKCHILLFLFYIYIYTHIVCGESGGDEAHVMCLIYRWCTFKYGLLSLYFVVSSSPVTFHFYTFQTHFIYSNLSYLYTFFLFIPINNIQFIYTYVHNNVLADLTSPSTF